MPELSRYRDTARESASRIMPSRRERGTEKRLGAIEDSTIARIAKVRAEVMVSKEKMRGSDYLAREAMAGQALLRQWAHVLSYGDPILADELDIFPAMAKTAKLQVLSDFARDAFDS